MNRFALVAYPNHPRHGPDSDNVMRVLVADDDRLIREMVDEILSAAAYDVVTCNDGAAALELLKQGDVRLAVLDWLMPGMTGLEVCEQLQSTDRLRAVHAILLTSRSDAKDVVTALTKGASDYVTKPFRPGELLARVNVGRRIVKLQAQLVQAQKLESIGQLAAGVAHEINTPIQYVSDNTQFILDGFAKLGDVLSVYGQALESAVDAPLNDEWRQRLEQARSVADLDYLREEMPAALRQSLDGLEHVSKIVRAMKDFSHAGSEERTPVDLNRNIAASIMVAKNEWKFVAEVETDFDDSLPAVPCVASDISQTVLNLLINAAHAIGDVVQDGQKGKITVATHNLGDRAEIRVTDTGAGVPEPVREKIFDPFFTTKEVGRGTGQGLSIAYAAIVDRHGGAISFETGMGRGTTFIIELPLEPENAMITA